MTDVELVKSAKDSLENSYSPYSNFKVGVALLTENGKIYTGVNIENSSYSATVCAERTAIFKAVSDGKTKFSKIAIVSSNDDFCYPCGVCRQVMAEFCSNDFEIILSSKNELKVFTLAELLPHFLNYEYVCGDELCEWSILLKRKKRTRAFFSGN